MKKLKRIKKLLVVFTMVFSIVLPLTPMREVHAVSGTFIDDGVRTVTFDDQGGSGGPGTVNIDDNAAMPTVTRPTKAGYEFMGYYKSTNGAGGCVWDSAGKPKKTTNTGVTDYTVYAYWLPVITITLNNNGGSGGTTTFYKSNLASKYYSDSTLTTEITQISVPTKASNTFSGYYYNGSILCINANGTFTDAFKQSSITSMTAKWVAVDNSKYLIKAQAGTGISELFLSKTANATSGLASPAYFESGGKVYVFIKMYEGYTAPGGSVALGNGLYRATQYPTGFSDTLSSNHDFGTVNAVANTYTVTLNKQEGTGGLSSVTATYDSAMPAAAMPTRTGYSFGGYYDAAGKQYYNADGSSAGIWDKTSDTTLYARWISHENIVSFDFAGGSGGSDYISISFGEDMSPITLPTRTGYTFLGYFDAASGGTKYYNANGSSAKNWDKTEATTLYAQWQVKQTTITLDKQSGTGGDSSVTATYGSAMSAVTMPTRTGGYILIGYYSEVNGGGTKYYNADGTSARTWNIEDANKTLYAYWLQDEALLDVIAKIDAIENPVVLTDTCHSHILTARAAYDALTQYQEYVPNYQTLVDAEARYAVLLQAQSNATSIDALIGQIGTVSYPVSGGAISAARTAYDNADAETKALVNNYATLTAAESEYATKRTTAINNVIDLIDAITGVNYPTVKTFIDAARAAYNALVNDDKPSITNYDILTVAETSYDHVKNTDDSINAIGTVEYNDACKTKIDAARAAYDALTNAEKTLLGSDAYNTLIAAEDAYAALKAARDAAEPVEALIDAIGTVEYNDACKNKIDAARTAYDALTAEQKAVVSNVATLVAAEERYAQLESDIQAAASVEGKINDIENPVVLTDTCHEHILAAREAYNALTPAQEALVSSAAKKKLKDAEEAYDVLYGDAYLKITYISTGKVTKGEKGDLVIKTSGDLDKLIKILINGKELDAINYKLEKGSTIFTLKESYLKNLDPGKYKVTFVYTTGKSVDASFTIEGSTKETEEGKAVPVNDKAIAPKTGDNVLIYVLMFGLGMLCLAGSGYCRYKKKK